MIWLNNLIHGLIFGKLIGKIEVFHLYHYYKHVTAVFSSKSSVSYFSPWQWGLLPGHHHWHGTHYEYVHCWAVWRYCHGECKIFLLLPACLHPPFPLRSLIVSVLTLFRFTRLTQSSPDLHRKGVHCLLEGHLQTSLPGSLALKHDDICVGPPLH